MKPILKTIKATVKGKPLSIQGSVFDTEWRLNEIKRKSVRQGPMKPILKTIKATVKGRILKASGTSEMKEQHFQSAARAVPEMKQSILETEKEEMKQPISETKIEEKVDRTLKMKPPVETRVLPGGEPGKKPPARPP